jgi:hypothetical protein
VLELIGRLRRNAALVEDLAALGHALGHVRHRTVSSMNRVRSRTCSRRYGTASNRAVTSGAASRPRNRAAYGSVNSRSAAGNRASSARIPAMAAALSAASNMGSSYLSSARHRYPSEEGG